MSVLVTLTHIRGSKHGSLIAEQLVDVTMRVKVRRAPIAACASASVSVSRHNSARARAQPVRKFAVQSMVLLLLDPKVMIGQGLLTIADVLCAACWITGEYASFLEGITDVDEDDEDDEREDAQQRQRARIRAIPTADLCFKLVDALTHPRVTNLPAYVQNVYLLNALKVFVHACKHAPPDEIERTVMLVDDRMGVFMQSVHVEVQERSTSFRQMLVAFGIVAAASAEPSPAAGDAPAPVPDSATTTSLIGDLMDASVAAAPIDGGASTATSGAKIAAVKQALSAMEAMLADKMVPVNPRAQAKVPLPEGLDLTLPIDDDAVGDFFADADDEHEATSHADELAKVTFTALAFVPEADDGFGESPGGFAAAPDADDDGERYAGQAPALFPTHDRNDPHDPFYLSRSVHPNEVGARLSFDSCLRNPRDGRSLFARDARLRRSISTMCP